MFREFREYGIMSDVKEVYEELVEARKNKVPVSYVILPCNRTLTEGETEYKLNLSSVRWDEDCDALIIRTGLYQNELRIPSTMKVEEYFHGDGTEFLVYCGQFTLSLLFNLTLEDVIYVGL